MKEIEALIAAFGSQTAIAEAAGVSKPAVSNWRTAGVPLKHKLALLRLARERRLALSPADIGLGDLLEPKVA